MIPVKLLPHFFLLLVSCVALSGCFGTSSNSSPKPEGVVPNSRSDFLRVGDKITIRLTGVPDEGYIVEIQIPQSGEISVSYLSQSFRAVGETAADLAEQISQAYKTQKIYSSPTVTVIPEERYVSVGGEVRSPTRVLYTPDLTLLTAINSCGGFTDYAKRGAVRIIRGEQVIYVDCAAAVRNAGLDPALFPGDQIYVQRTVF